MADRNPGDLCAGHVPDASGPGKHVVDGGTIDRALFRRRSVVPLDATPAKSVGATGRDRLNLDWGMWNVECGMWDAKNCLARSRSLAYTRVNVFD